MLTLISNKRDKYGISVHIYYPDKRTAVFALKTNYEWWELFVDHLVPDKDENGFFIYNYDLLTPRQKNFLKSLFTYYFQDSKKPFSIYCSWNLSTAQIMALNEAGFRYKSGKYKAHVCKWKEVVETLRGF